MHHRFYLFYVKTSRGEVSSHKNRTASVVEKRNGGLSFSLVERPVIQHTSRPLSFKEVINPLGALPMVNKHYGLLRLRAVVYAMQKSKQRVKLVFAV